VSVAVAPGGQAGPPPAGRPEEGFPASAPASPAVSQIWRAWRVPLAIIALILLGGTVVGLVQPAGGGNGYLDPASTGPAGSRALAGLLASLGHQVIRTTTVAGATAASGAAATADATLIVTSPGRLSPAQLRSLSGRFSFLLIIAPDDAALAALAPGIGLAGDIPGRSVQPGCGLTAARLAGSAQLAGPGYQVLPGGPAAVLCYRAGEIASLVRFPAAGRVITILGTGAPLQNGHLSQDGNAALSLNLLGGTSRIVWLVPSPSAVAAGQPRSLTSLLPLGADLVLAQLGVVVLLTALWRARRLGPVIAERLPVVVRAAETVEGHGRLYQSRRARDRAAAALRGAVLGRLIPAAGLAAGASPAAVAAALAARTGRPGRPAMTADRIEPLLFGPPPASDAALTALADDLDALEREVRAQ
jgi:hypothetical protein